MLNLGRENCFCVIHDTRRDPHGCLCIGVKSPVVLFLWYVDVVPIKHSSTH